MTEPWLVVTDMDGTLFDHSLEVRPRTRAAIRALQEAGHVVTIATGRMYRATQPYAAAVGLHEPLICYQGALIQSAEAVIAHHTLSLEVARDAVRFAREEGRHLNVYVDDRLFVEARSPEADFYLTLSPTAALEEVGDMATFLQHEPTKLVFIQSEAETAGVLERAAARWNGRAQVVRSHPRFVELTHPEANKGRALLELAERLAIPPERTLALGDNHNDLSMIHAAAIGVAIGNAVPEVRAAADWVAPTLDEDGWAAAVERFILGNGRG